MLDGNGDKSTESHKHLCQKFILQSMFVTTDSGNSLPFAEDHYLSCIKNKNESIEFVYTLQKQFKVEVYNSFGDADSSTVEKSLDYASL